MQRIDPFGPQFDTTQCNPKYFSQLVDLDQMKRKIMLKLIIVFTFIYQIHIT